MCRHGNARTNVPNWKYLWCHRENAFCCLSSCEWVYVIKSIIIEFDSFEIECGRVHAWVMSTCRCPCRHYRLHDIYIRKCIPYSAWCAMIVVCRVSIDAGRCCWHCSSYWCRWYFRTINYRRIRLMCCSKYWPLMDRAKRPVTANNIPNHVRESFSNDFPDKFPVKIKEKKETNVWLILFYATMVE